jgi:hypothetical protein
MWRKDAIMKKSSLFSALALLLTALTIPMASGQDINIVRPSFIESAVFFLTGKEPPAAVALSDTAMRLRDKSADFRQSKDDPCLVIELQTAPPYGLTSYDFSKFPGPRSATGRYTDAAVFTLPSGAIQTAKRRFTSDCNNTMPTCTLELVPGSTRMVGDGGTFSLIGGTTLVRQLAALTYIRDDFCPGLPEPPITIKPY